MAGPRRRRGAELNQQADTERRTALASAATPDDPTTPAVDEHQASVATGTVHSTTPPP